MPLETADAATILAGRADWIDREGVERLAEHPLASVETEFPHHHGRLESGDPDDLTLPSERHPVFYGCYDWHSAVHSHWALVRAMRLFEDHPRETAIVERIDRRLTDENVRQEVAYLEDNPTFEKPYGWAWLLHLAAELDRWEHERADEWLATLAPLEEQVLELVREQFLTQDRPFRVGTHGNSAFALSCVLDCARSTGRTDLANEAAAVARRFYADDRDAPVEYEPLGWDFLSPALAEADLLRRVYDADEFATWLEGFLPDVRASPYDAVLEPVAVAPSPDEGVALHLVGLNLSRAWALAGITDALEDGNHPYADALRAGARRHAEAGLSAAFTDDYAGAHWLSSFALYLLTRSEGGIGVAPGE